MSPSEVAASVPVEGTSGRGAGGFDITDKNIMSSAMGISSGIIQTGPDDYIKNTAYLAEDIIKKKEAREAKEAKDDIDRGLCLDSTWLTNQIMIPANELDSKFKMQAYKSTAHLKFQDTTIGGHRAVNAPPQFTRYCDIRANDYFYPWDPTMNTFSDNTFKNQINGSATSVVSKISFNTNTAHTGMGRFYAQALDDGAQELYLQFGIPEFNGLASFFMGAVTYEDAYIARHGTIPTVYQAINPIVKFLTFIAMPGTFVMSWLLKKTVGCFLGNNVYKYYYMKPAMHIYWSTVNQIANQIATAMGILAPMFMEEGTDGTNGSETRKAVKDYSSLELEKDISSISVSTKDFTQGRVMKFNSDLISSINAQFSDGTTIFSSTTNYIDVYELSTRYQNRVNKFMKSGLDDIIKETNGVFQVSNFQEFIYKIQGQKYTMFSKLEPFLYKEDIDQVKAFQKKDKDNVEKKDERGKKSAFDSDLNGVIDKDKGAYPAGTVASQPGKPKYEYIKGPNIDDGRAKEQGTSIGGRFKSALSGSAEAFKNFWNRRARVFDATSRLANTQVVFLVQPTGATAESFSNSTGEIQSAGLIKSFGKAAHDMRFNFAGGKTGISFIDKGIDAAMQVGNSIIDNVTFGFSDVVRGLLMGAYVDVPKIWEDSSGNFPSITYTMDLIAPYGNTYSRFQNIIVPLSCILAGALPLKVGKASYTSPFLCQAYCQGVQHIRLGLITDLNITRNNGNTQQTLDKKTNFVTVSFTITDLGSRIAAPINNSLFNDGGWFPMLEEDTPFADYVNALSGKHISDMNWIWPSIGHNLTTAAKKVEGYLSPTAFVGAIGNAIGSSPVTGWLFANPAIEANKNAL